MNRLVPPDIRIDTRSCPCGSGLPKVAEHDARGIFLTFACAKCRRRKLSRFRPDVLTNPGYHADEPIDPEPEVPSRSY